MTTLEHQIDQLVAAWRRIHAVDPAAGQFQLQLLEGMASRLENPEAARAEDARRRQRERAERLDEQISSMSSLSDSQLRLWAKGYEIKGRKRMSRARLLAAVQQARRERHDEVDQREARDSIRKLIDLGIVRVEPLPRPLQRRVAVQGKGGGR